LGDLMRHEHAPLALAQRCSRVPAPAPLFSSVLNYRHSVDARAGAGAARRREGIEALVGEERSNYPLMLSVDDLHDGFRLTAQIAEPIDPGRVCALVVAPTQAIARVDVLPEAELRQVVEGWNATGMEYPRGARVHELLEAQAR